MQLLYSGAASNGAAQTDPNKSLGGFISSSPIANGALNNIFPPISKKHIVSNVKDIRLIVLKNVSGMDFSTLKIWTASGSLSEYNIAVVLPAISNSVQFFEKIIDGTSEPFMATLSQQEGESNAVDCGTFANGSVLGIWISRSVDGNALKIDDQKIMSGDDNEIAKLETKLANGSPLDEGQLIIDFS